MTIINLDDAREVDEHIDKIFAAASPDERASEIRRLFVEALDFAPDSGQVPLVSTSTGVSLPQAADRIAALDGVHVCYVALDTQVTDRVRKQEASAAARQLAEQLGEDLLLVFTNTSASQLHLIHPVFEGTQPTLRRMVVERDLPRRTAVQQIANIYANYLASGRIRSALESAFDVEPVTKRFFAEYKRVFEAAEQLVVGFNTDAADEDEARRETEARRMFVQTLFNRLMFVHFVSLKGWLTFDKDNDYLNALWRSYETQETTSDDANFYSDRLSPLFFRGLGTQRETQAVAQDQKIFGVVPFLNGGLFDESKLDPHPDVLVPDEAIRPILYDLFGRFNFTVLESTPFDIEVAVDPEMLGKVFEELVTGRHDTGSYYTPRQIVSFMCRESIKGYLQAQRFSVSHEAIRKFVDHRDTDGLSPAVAPDLSQALRDVRILDPACGSGAYLLGMLQELVEIRSALFDIGITPEGLYELKLHVIERNIYGADNDEIAVNIAMLRLWLSLAIDFLGEDPPALPNLDFKIVCGDSLLGPDPSPENYGDLSHDLAARLNLSHLKSEYLKANTEVHKQSLKTTIGNVERQVKLALGDAAVPSDVVDWRIAFAEVYDDSNGFDMVIANPPYVNVFRIDRERPGYRRAIADKYVTATGRFDLFVPFMERAVRLLASRGMFCFITPNKYLGAEYARRLRTLLSENLSITSIADLSSVPVFSASVYPIITIGQQTDHPDANSAIHVFTTSQASHHTSGLRHLHSISASITAYTDNNWSPFLHPDTVELQPILQSPVKLGDVADIAPAAWVNEAYDIKDALINDGLRLTQTSASRFARFIVSGSIIHHGHTWATRPVRYLKQTYRQPAIDLDHPSVSETRRTQIRSPKLITSGMSMRPRCVWDRDGIAAGVSTTYLFPRTGVSGPYLAGVLNSRLMGDVYRILFGSLSLAGGVFASGRTTIEGPSSTDGFRSRTKTNLRLSGQVDGFGCGIIRLTCHPSSDAK